MWGSRQLLEAGGGTGPGAGGDDEIHDLSHAVHGLRGALRAPRCRHGRRRPAESHNAVVNFDDDTRSGAGPNEVELPTHFETDGFIAAGLVD